MSQERSYEDIGSSYIDDNFKKLETVFQETDYEKLPTPDNPGALSKVARYISDIDELAEEVVSQWDDNANDSCHEAFVVGVGWAYLVAGIAYKKQLIAVQLKPQVVAADNKVWNINNHLTQTADIFMWSSPTVTEYFDRHNMYGTYDKASGLESAAVFLGFFSTSALLECQSFDDVASEMSHDDT